MRHLGRSVALCRRGRSGNVAALFSAALATACTGATPGPMEPSLGLEAPPSCADTPVLCEGADAPRWRLVDHQPKSARKGQRYGLEAFLGKVTVVALLAGW